MRRCPAFQRMARKEWAVFAVTAPVLGEWNEGARCLRSGEMWRVEIMMEP